MVVIHHVSISRWAFSFVCLISVRLSVLRMFPDHTKDSFTVVLMMLYTSECLKDLAGCRKSVDLSFGLRRICVDSSTVCVGCYLRVD
jgi:hypothetical protein